MNVRLAMLLLLTTVAARERGAATGDCSWIGAAHVANTVAVGRAGGPGEDVAVGLAEARLQHVSVFGDLTQPGQSGPEIERAGVGVVIAFAEGHARHVSTTSHRERTGS